MIALVGLTFQNPSWAEWISVVFVMSLQALSGVAKDLTKMSSKSAVKYIAGEGALFRLVAILTGSKNALKGLGFFLGAVLLSWIGYDAALWSMAISVTVVLVAIGVLLDEDIGRAKVKPPLRSILSKSTAINRLSAARFFLFGSRDIWFVVALPIFFADELGLAVRADRRVPRRLADRVRHRAVVRTAPPASLDRQCRRRDRRRAGPGRSYWGSCRSRWRSAWRSTLRSPWWSSGG